MGKPDATATAIARDSIRDLVARYNQLGDRGRIEELAALFCRDATLEIVGAGRHEGRAAIGAFFAAVADDSHGGGALHSLAHHTATHQVDILDSQSARGRSYFSVYTDRGLDHWGRYRDEYACEEGQWRFRSRIVRVDGRVAGGWADRRDRAGG